ncbi:helix-turn-helix transcriptional regulator [Weissella confusa]|uniref:helix-turn-helix domain-containing protein n=1 Tax=Weissella confusa TaxID=1583 RepID=UPI0018F11FCA|nr:helix-turn-helix transcriptional regulator [Weissella confusa]MBJ7620991.1 helix-turn-helix transcriptional regulator [Weissella confusa]MBJ7668290.1 helix-turn-helix transcriptional regulator [Weissella confusa]MCT0005075.1 XRE family transcriptional regulator [Weissella confusa]MCT0018764.1 XRE family transcriptional regulator [Weissella confusa]MCT0039351.1 XRE family transcriptional regulator [Weissella confusa]
MTLFERIKETAKERGISLTALSVESGLGEKTIYKWKDKEPSANRIKAVADTLGVSVDYLLGNTDEMHSNKKNDKTVDLEKDTTILALDGMELSDDYKQFIIDQVRSLRKLRGDDE